MGCSYTLWPVDRAESRGRLKALSVRISDSQLVILSYKALPWWQDMRLGRDSWNVSDRDNVIADEMRPTLSGLSVEYMKKLLDNSTGEGPEDRWTRLSWKRAVQEHCPAFTLK
jgi:hypothetical protein